MEFAYYLAAGVALYFLSDSILLRLERWRGEVFEQRTLIFFAIISVLAVGSFQLVGWFVAR